MQPYTGQPNECSAWMAPSKSLLRTRSEKLGPGQDSCSLGMCIAYSIAYIAHPPAHNGSDSTHGKLLDDHRRISVASPCHIITCPFPRHPTVCPLAVVSGSRSGPVRIRGGGQGGRAAGLAGPQCQCPEGAVGQAGPGGRGGAVLGHSVPFLPNTDLLSPLLSGPPVLLKDRRSKLRGEC